MSELINEYEYTYNTYPVWSQEFSYEGSLKRFSPFPTPVDVFNYTLMGLPKIFPLTGEPIPLSFAEDALNSAITDIEMATGMNISESSHFKSIDYIDGFFSNNYFGTLLERFPATRINYARIKYPHTNVNPIFTTENGLEVKKNQFYQILTLPPSWLYLRRNKFNVIAGAGTVNVSTTAPESATLGSLFNFFYRFSAGSWQPGFMEISYVAGFQQDKLPSSVADLIKTWASARLLSDLTPVLFPNSGVSVSLDGVSQSVSYNISAMLQKRLQDMLQKREELKNNVLKQFGRSVKMSFIGS